MHARRTTMAVLMLATVTLTAAAVGCGGSGGAGSAKVGAPVAPVTLRLADANRGTATPGVLDFVRDVKQLSHGAVTIEIVKAPNTSLDYEGDIVRATASEKWDLAWVGGRTLDSVGVPSAGALQVPFLIDNYATQRKVLLGPIGRRLTRDMSKAGVTGLALIPDHLSYFATPIDSLDDLAGKRMRAFGRSRSQIAAFRAMGATPVPLNGTTPTATAQMKKHHLFGIESNPLIWSEFAYPGSTYTLGAPIWPRTAALFAAPERFARLPDATQQLLRNAAARAAREADQALVADDTRAVAQICQLGGSVAVLDRRRRDAMVQAGADSMVNLPADTAPPDLVAKIVALKGGAGPQAPPHVPDGCTPDKRPSGKAVTADPAQINALRKALRPGTIYRSRIDYDVFRRLLGENPAHNNAGTYTFRFLVHNRWSVVHKPQFADAASTGCLKGDGPFKQVGLIVKTTFSCDGDVIHERARCMVSSGAIDCRITFDDGGYPADPRLGLQGMTEPLMPIQR
jgi:TRAP-type C4-dicarboxylate transport system substrate-binding protein